MNNTALTIMLVAMVLIWGGLIASMVHLIKNPDIALEDVKNEL